LVPSLQNRIPKPVTIEKLHRMVLRTLKERGAMISVNSGPIKRTIDEQQHSSEIRASDQCASSQPGDFRDHSFRGDDLYRRQNVSLFASQLIQAQENERKHLSRELHDDIGQRLSLAASEAALMASQNYAGEAISDKRFNDLRDELYGLCSDIHEMSHNLHSYKLQHLGLKTALKELSRKISQPNLRVSFYADEFEEPDSKDVALCLYRVAQESLANAVKHSHTLAIAVTLTKLEDVIYMTIQDSGVGFDSSVRSQGLGLLSMSERVRLLNGQFRLQSIPGRGTEIWVAVPDEKRQN
jgi:signal transduction histidine kinase